MLNVFFKTRFFITLAMVILASLTVPFLYYRNALLEDIEAEAEASAARRVNFVHWLMESHGGFESDQQFGEWLRQVSDRLGVRETYVSADGRVIADTMAPTTPTAEADGMAERPEIVQARSRDVGVSLRFSNIHGQMMIFAAQSVPAQGVIPAGVIRLAMEVPALKERLGLFTNIYLVLGGMLLLFAGFISYHLAHRVDRLTAIIIGAADAVAAGNYRHRTRVSPGKEYDPLIRSTNRMLESIDERIFSIMGQKQELEAILNGMREGVMVLDAQGRVRTVNRAMGSIAPGIAQLAGRRPLEIIMSPELQSACDKVLAGGQEFENHPFNLQITLERERIYDVNIVTLHNAEEADGAILVLYDISELKRLEKVRQDFVANVSHELRTPLTSIKGYAETLLVEEPQGSGKRGFLEIILKNANHMARIVNDLLQLARLESRKSAINPSPVDARKLLGAAWDACAPLAENKKVRFVSEVSEKWAWVEADPDQLLQVFINLMDNAVKYSPEGGMVTASNSMENGVVVFSITDEGPGIPKSDQQRVFERFYRVEKHRTVQTGGSGLGLAICRHIIKNHHGRIWVESPPEGKEKGAAFLFSLPPSVGAAALSVA